MNQCDGCMAGIPVIRGSHRMGKEGGYSDPMSCTKDRYVEPQETEDEEGESDGLHLEPRG